MRCIFFILRIFFLYFQNILSNLDMRCIFFILRSLNESYLGFRRQLVDKGRVRPLLWRIFYTILSFFAFLLRDFFKKIALENFLHHSLLFCFFIRRFFIFLLWRIFYTILSFFKKMPWRIFISFSLLFCFFIQRIF